MYPYYADNMTRNFSSAVSDYLSIDTEKKRAIMRRHAFMGRMICCIIIGFSYVSSLIFMLSPISENDKNVQVNVSIKDVSALPIPLKCNLANVHISTNIYLVIFLVECFLIILNCFAFLGTDALYHAITLHVCGQVELLKIELINFGVESKNENKDFLKLTRRHHYLLDHAQLLSDAISFILLMQILISCILICILGFQLILALKVGDAKMIIKAGMVLSTLLLQLLAYSFVGDYLKYQVEDVAQSIFYCNWYCLSIKFMKNVLFVIMRSQQPVQLTAGKFLVVNIETYMSIIKTSQSYLFVLCVILDT